MDKQIKEWVLENLANLVTFLGLFMTIWVLVIVARNPEELGLMVAISIGVVLSDFADGKIAKNLGKKSSFGAAFDPLRDKVFVVPSLIILTWHYRWTVATLPTYLVTPIIALVALLIFIESILFIAWWILLIAKKLQVPINEWGRWKTFGEFVVIVLWLISLIIEKYFKVQAVQFSIYLIGLALIATSILAYASLKTYYQEYLEIAKNEKAQ